MANRYYDALKQTASQMDDLAERLGKQKAQPLKPEEKQLIRLAVLPQVRGMLDEALYSFTAGKSFGVPGAGPLEEFFAMANDLKE